MKDFLTSNGFWTFVGAFLSILTTMIMNRYYEYRKVLLDAMQELAQPNLSSNSAEVHRLAIHDRLRNRIVVQALLMDQGQIRTAKELGARFMKDLALRDEMMIAMTKPTATGRKPEAIIEDMKVSVGCSLEVTKLEMDMIPLLLGGWVTNHLRSTGELQDHK